MIILSDRNRALARGRIAMIDLGPMAQTPTADITMCASTYQMARITVWQLLMPFGMRCIDSNDQKIATFVPNVLTIYTTTIKALTLISRCCQ